MLLNLYVSVYCVVVNIVCPIVLFLLAIVLLPLWNVHRLFLHVDINMVCKSWISELIDWLLFNFKWYGSYIRDDKKLINNK